MTGPTPCVSPIVVVPKKSGEVRICVDMREANKAVQREKHVMPTLDELIADLNGATKFSTLDLSAGYHQLLLDEPSRYITTFSTHAGLHRYKRLMFGLNAAAEIFQNAIAEILSGVPGCKNISDDILVYGTDETHDSNLLEVLKRLQDVGATLNPDKCQFFKRSVKFYGHVFSAQGISVDQSKTKAIKEAANPENVAEVRSLLGMAQYVSRFIPNYATLVEPLRQLTKNKTEWRWGKEEEASLKKLKDMLCSSHVLEYFNPKKETEILVDASPTGLAAVLTQEGKVIAYASRSLSDTERRYSQTEREMLAVVWSVEHFRLYVYGASFKVVTDHKPLLGLFKSQKQNSPRIDRWKLRLTPYSCKLEYGKGDENPADFLSRHPCPQAPKKSIADDYARYVIKNATPKAMTLDEIRCETQNDSLMRKLIIAITRNEWEDPDLQPFKRSKDIREELSVVSGLVLRSNRIVIPPLLQKRAVDLAHVGHQGSVKTKKLLREKVWFPYIDKMVENTVKECMPCQAANPAQKLEPLCMTTLPKCPWTEVSIDFAGPFPCGNYLLVVIDDFSRYPEVEIVSSTSARATIPKLDAIFARQGIPEVVKTDNGPPFQGKEFVAFAKYCGFHHRKITPLWPRANGEAERFMRTVNKSIKTANAEGKNWKQELFKFLRQYRATPHSTTGISPSMALNGRNLRTTLPQVSTSATLEKQTKDFRQRDAEKKEVMKQYFDSRFHAKDSHLTHGDIVLAKQVPTNKLSTPFKAEPYTVVDKKGSMVTARNSSHELTRNSSHFKKVQGAPCVDDNVRTGEDMPERIQVTESTPVSVPLRRSGRERKAPRRLIEE